MQRHVPSDAEMLEAKRGVEGLEPATGGDHSGAVAMDVEADPGGAGRRGKGGRRSSKTSASMSAAEARLAASGACVGCMVQGGAPYTLHPEPV